MVSCHRQQSLTILMVVEITMAFGTNMAVFDFFMWVTESTGILIWGPTNHNTTSVRFHYLWHNTTTQMSRYGKAKKGEKTLYTKGLITARKMLYYLCVSAKDFGMKTDPVIRHKQSALIKDVFLQGTSVTWGQTPDIRMMCRTALLS